MPLSLVFIYLYVCVRAYVSVYVCMRVGVCACLWVFSICDAHVCVYVIMYIRVCVYRYERAVCYCIRICKCVRARTSLYMRMHVLTGIWACMHAFVPVRVCEFVRVRMYVYEHVYLYVCTWINVHMCACVYMCVRASVCAGDNSLDYLPFSQYKSILNLCCQKPKLDLDWKREKRNYWYFSFFHCLPRNSIWFLWKS